MSETPQQSSSKKESIALEALKYLTGRAYGKPTQSLDVSSGQLEKAHQSLAAARARVKLRGLPELFADRHLYIKGS